MTVNKIKDLVGDRFLAALCRFRDYIAGGGKFWAFDDTTPGDKDTQCSFGLCCNDVAMWPDKQDHIWPEQFPKRSAPLSPGKGLYCPMDRRLTGEDQQDGNGCFYHCRVFKPRGKGVMAISESDRPRVLELYDIAIEKFGVPVKPQ